MLARRGNRSPMQTEIGKANHKKAVQAKYGVDNVAQLDSTKEKMRQTNRERYGVDYVMQDPEIRAKAEATCQAKYGSTYYIGSQECRDKFGKENLLKMLDTKKKNGTFNSSHPEEEYYEYLLTIYPKDDVVRQYRDERYPFNCDFYIKSLDLFIECNYSWTHGGKPFDPEDEECKAKLAKWKEDAKHSKYVRNAINTWTIRDPNKREVAKENNLNYIEIFN